MMLELEKHDLEMI